MTFFRISSLLLYFGTLVVLAKAEDGYFPPAIFGVPLNGTVTTRKTDFTGQESYRIDFWVRQDNGIDVKTFIHRTYPDFQQFDSQKPWYYRLELPDATNTNSLTLNAYIKRVFDKRALADSELFSDFVGINWDGNDSEYQKNFATFMRFLTQDRLPAFPPEPPVFASEAEAVVEELCPYENYIFSKAFRNDDIGLDGYLEYYEQYVDTLPLFAGDKDDSDVWLPGVKQPVEYPYHYITTQVHFNPGGYINGHTARMSFSTQNKFNFLQRDKLADWFERLHGDRNPRKVLDMATGNGFSAIELARLYPNAEVLGIDMAAPYVRFAREWNKQLGLKNLFFYQGNCESLPSLESATFDLIQYTYVVHEMPTANAKRFLQEAMRLLKPGGVLSGFEVTYWENDVWREVNIERNTWGVDWNDTSAQHGPEPYIAEYQDGTKLPYLLAEMGFVDPIEIRYSNFDGIYVFHKPV